MANTKFLDLTGLQTYDEKIKALIDSKDATTLQSAKTYADDLGSNYDPAGTAETKTQELANGQVKTNTDAITALKSGKADKATTLSGYGIADAYTKTQTDSAIATAVANAGHLKREIVAALPDAGEADEHTIYMVGTGEGSETSVYEEYMLINGGFEKIGSSEVDLSNYATKAYADQAEADAIATAGTNADSKIAAKVGEIGGSTVKQYVDQAKSDAQDYADSLASNYATAEQGTKADTALQKADVTTGTANGTIAVKGTDVQVKGLGSAAYTASSAYATAAQGTKADTALQKADIASGGANGTISVDGTDVAVKGLGSAAYKAAGSASGNVPVNGAALGTVANVPVVTNASGQLVPHASGALKSAAFAETSAFDAVGTAQGLVTALEEGAVATNTSAIAALDGRIDALEGTTYTAISTEEIEALFD